MTLILHILIAISSVSFTTFMFFSPSEAKLKISYGLMAATIASGTVLVLSDMSHMLQACTMGLIYTGVTTVTIVATRSKLATVKSMNRSK